MDNVNKHILDTTLKDFADTIPELNFEAMVNFISKSVDIDKETIEEVLRLEEEYLYSKGIDELANTVIEKLTGKNK